MSYQPFVIGNPDGSTGTGATFAQQLRDNLNALTHGVVIGAMRSWNYAQTIGTGTADKPQFMTWSNGVYRLRASPTWNVEGNPSSILWEYSANSGSSYSVVGTCTYTYDAAQNCTAYTWS